MLHCKNENPPQRASSFTQKAKLIPAHRLCWYSPDYPLDSSMGTLSSMHHFIIIHCGSIWDATEQLGLQSFSVGLRFWAQLTTHKVT